MYGSLEASTAVLAAQRHIADALAELQVANAGYTDTAYWEQVRNLLNTLAGCKEDVRVLVNQLYRNVTVGDRIMVQAHPILGTPACPATVKEVTAWGFLVHCDGDSAGWLGPVDYNGVPLMEG